MRSGSQFSWWHFFPFLFFVAQKNKYDVFKSTLLWYLSSWCKIRRNLCAVFTLGKIVLYCPHAWLLLPPLSPAVQHVCTSPIQEVECKELLSKLLTHTQKRKKKTCVVNKAVFVYVHCSSACLCYGVENIHGQWSYCACFLLWRHQQQPSSWLSNFFNMYRVQHSLFWMKCEGWIQQPTSFFRHSSCMLRHSCFHTTCRRCLGNHEPCPRTPFQAYSGHGWWTMPKYGTVRSQESNELNFGGAPQWCSG